MTELRNLLKKLDNKGCEARAELAKLFYAGEVDSVCEKMGSADDRWATFSGVGRLKRRQTCRAIAARLRRWSWLGPPTRRGCRASKVLVVMSSCGM
jgi:hypothetical protein